MGDMIIEEGDLLVSDTWGIYIPQRFAEIVDRSEMPDVLEETWRILEDGPENDFYWDAWDEVLNERFSDDSFLYQDGDLW